METDYTAFLKSKVRLAESWGFVDIAESEVNPILKPHQRATVLWNLRGGRRADFLSFGLGKTPIQLETLRLLLTRVQGRALIVCPLGVRQEFARDAVKLLGWAEAPKFIRSITEAGDTGIYLTNYETVRDGKIDPADFVAVSLDEAAILRGFGGSKTFRELMLTCTGDGGPCNRDRETGRRVAYRFVATATPSPNDYIELLAYAEFLGVMDISQAKAQPLDAKILTPKGWRLMGDIRVGDLVISGDGSPTRVLGVYPQGERTIYRVTFSDGSSTECDADHLWLTHTQYERNNERRYLARTRKANDWRARKSAEFATVKTTTQIQATLLAPQGGRNHSIPIAGAAELESRPVAIDPWLLGALLGDACLRDTSITFSTMDDWMRERVQAALPSGLSLRATSRGVCDYGVTTTGERGGRGPGSNPLLSALRSYGLLGKRSWEKSIPADYLSNSIEVRLAVLRGLMDTDGTYDRSNGASFTSTSAQLASDLVALARSLGGVASVIRKRSVGRSAYFVRVSMPKHLNPFSLPRKAAKWKPQSVGPMRYIMSVKEAGTKPAQCIAIEHPSRLYVTDDFVVTHNTRFFKRDSTKADNLTLHPHKEHEFWMWVSSWALFVQRPSDLGFDDTGYELPEMEVRWHQVATDHKQAGAEKSGQMKLLRDAAIGVQDAAAEKRSSLSARMAKIMEIRAEDPTAHRIIWHDLEDERRALEAAIPSLVTVCGSDTDEHKEASILGFADGGFPEIALKPSMFGAGVNLQRHCAWAIYSGIGFKFHEFIQSLHRIYRFLQAKRVRIDLIVTEAEAEVRKELERKWRQHNDTVSKMTSIIRQYGLSHSAMAQTLTRKLGVERVEITGPAGAEPGKQLYRIVNSDCVEETRRMVANSVGLVLTSIPFSSQYEYSPNYADFGHSEGNAEFFQQMDFLTPELLRVLAPGRVAAVHVKDRIVPMGMTGLGSPTVYPFHCETIRHYVRHGFAYMGMKTIVTDVVRENNQTYRLGWTEQCKDGTKMGVGMPEYLLLFRKPPTDRTVSYADTPVVKSKSKYTRARWQNDAHGFTRSSGDRLLTPEELVGLPHADIFKIFREYSLSRVYDFEHVVKIGEALEVAGNLPSDFMLLQPQSWSPEVWTDITRMLTLNGTQAAKGKEMHLCPMQFDLADRVIAQFSNPGDVVYDPFGGLMTVPYRAIMAGRFGVGCELNPAYFADGAHYCRAAAEEMAMPTLFSLDELSKTEKKEDAA